MEYSIPEDIFIRFVKTQKWTLQFITNYSKSRRLQGQSNSQSKEN